MASTQHPAHPLGKRLILCCDGTWMDSDDGFTKPTLIPYTPTGVLQVPSNVTRIARALKRIGLDNKPQIIYYHSGVGTGSSAMDTLTGGMLGTGISENIREVYSFIAANYTPGDEIVLIGFSRGAFTARSVAGMIRDIGLLTRNGMDVFYPIFKDQENFKNDSYHDIFPNTPFPNKPHDPTSPQAAREYKRRLEELGFTRVYDQDGNKIRIQAVAVWDTVGSLGIPQIAFLAKLGLPHSTKEYKFYDTNLSGAIKHAFQALALDEHRGPFMAAVWERFDMSKTTVDLRQVWFPGAHANVGGGYDDQEIANISLAWMMDQLASIGLAFQDEYIDKIFAQNVEYYENPPKAPKTLSSLFPRRETSWAIPSVYEKHKPVRPWALGKIWNSDTSVWQLAGKKWRTPGLNMRSDPINGTPTNIPMIHTNERIHSCVRVRLDLEGLGLDDKGLYHPPALLDAGWQLRRMVIDVEDPIPWDASWGPETPAPEHSAQDDLRWVWEYVGPEETAPRERFMVEETLGPYERKLLLLNKGRKFYKRYKKRRRRKDRPPQYDRPMDDDLDEKFGEEYISNSRERDQNRDRDSKRRSRYSEKDIETFFVDESPRSGQHRRRKHKGPEIREIREEGAGREFRARDEVEVVGERVDLRDRSRARGEVQEEDEHIIEVIEEHDSSGSERERGPRRGSRPPPVSRERERKREKREDIIEVIEEHDEREGLVSPPPRYDSRGRVEGGGAGTGRRRIHRSERGSLLSSPEPEGRGGGRRSGGYREMM